MIGTNYRALALPLPGTTGKRTSSIVKSPMRRGDLSDTPRSLADHIGKAKAADIPSICRDRKVLPICRRNQIIRVLPNIS